MGDGLMRSRVAAAADRTAEASAPATGTRLMGGGSPRARPAWADSECDAVLVASSRWSPRSSSWSSSPLPSFFARLLDLARWLGEGGTAVGAGPWVGATGEVHVPRDGTVGPGAAAGLSWLMGDR